MSLTSTHFLSIGKILTSVRYQSTCLAVNRQYMLSPRTLRLALLILPHYSSLALGRIYREDTHTSKDKGCPLPAYDKRIPTVFPGTEPK